MVKTEYRRAFRSSAESVHLYESNVDYRLQRRQTEHVHRTDPFLWSPEVDSDSESTNSTDIHPGPPNVIQSAEEPQQREKYKKYVRVGNGPLRKKHIAVNNDTVHGKKFPKDDGSLSCHEVIPELQLEKLYLDEDERVSHAVTCPKHGHGQHKSTLRCQEISHKDGFEKSQTVVSKDEKAARRPRKPGQNLHSGKKILPKTRPMSAPLGRPSKKESNSSENLKAPFLPYGCKDKEQEVGTKRTHNVKASVDVYPAALRAQKRRQVAIALRERQAKSASLKEQRRKARFNQFDQKMQRETSQWDTEYNSHFVGYDRNEYRRSNSARAPHPRAVDHDEIGQFPPEHTSSYLRSSF